MAAGDIKAIGPFLRVLDRVDHYRGVAALRQFEGSYHREELLKKLNRAYEALQDDREDELAARRAAGLPDEPGGEDPGPRVAADEQAEADEEEVLKFFPPNFGRKP